MNSERIFPNLPKEIEHKIMTLKHKLEVNVLKTPFFATWSHEKFVQFLNSTFAYRIQRQYGDFSTETQLQRIFLEWAGKRWGDESGSRYWTNCDSIRTFTLVPTVAPNPMLEVNEEVRNYFAK